MLDHSGEKRRGLEVAVLSLIITICKLCPLRWKDSSIEECLATSSAVLRNSLLLSQRPSAGVTKCTKEWLQRQSLTNFEEGRV